MAAKASRSSMRVLPPLAWEGAGGIEGSTFSQNSSLTFHGFVRAISRRLLGAANRASLLRLYPTSYASFRIRTKAHVSMSTHGHLLEAHLCAASSSRALKR